MLTLLLDEGRISKAIFWSFPPCYSTQARNRLHRIINERLRQSLVPPTLAPVSSSANPTHPSTCTTSSNIARPYSTTHITHLMPHGRQHVVACRQANKERKGDEPDAQSKVGRDLGKGRDVVGRVVVGRHILDCAVLGTGEVAEPEVMIEKDEDCGRRVVSCWTRENGLRRGEWRRWIMAASRFQESGQIQDADQDAQRGDGQGRNIPHDAKNNGSVSLTKGNLLMLPR
jgi:hypothetical protein